MFAPHASSSSFLADSAGASTCIGGLVDAASDLGFSVVPLLFGSCEPAGTIAREAYESMRDELLDDLRAAMSDEVIPAPPPHTHTPPPPLHPIPGRSPVAGGGQPVDAVALDVHGAGVAEGYEDLERDLGAAVRQLVGADVPIVSTW